jgi:hypothetical protein
LWKSEDSTGIAPLPPAEAVNSAPVGVNFRANLSPAGISTMVPTWEDVENTLSSTQAIVKLVDHSV